MDMLTHSCESSPLSNYSPQSSYSPPSNSNFSPRSNYPSHINYSSSNMALSAGGYQGATVFDQYDMYCHNDIPSSYYSPRKYILYLFLYSCISFSWKVVLRSSASEEACLVHYVISCNK